MNMKNTTMHLIAPRSHVSQEMRETKQRHKGMTFWLTGLSGAGKSTLAHAAEAVLFQRDYHIVVLDGDVIRSGLCSDLGFSMEERRENNRRVAELAKLFVRSGIICLCAFISPSAAFRQDARRIIGEDAFREVYVACSVEECEHRDVKGFYKKARQGEIRNYTGISSAYETPLSPDCVINTEGAAEPDCAERLIRFIEHNAQTG
jgi:adenylyl-sulfate kinase